MGTITVELFIAICCIMANAFFVIAEFALVKVRSSRIQELVDGGSKRAILVSRMLEDVEGYLSATQLGITMMSLGLGWLGEPAVATVIKIVLPESITANASLLHTVSLGGSFAIITFLHIVFGELIPRVLGIRHAENVTLTVAPLIIFTRKLFGPLLIILNTSAKFFLSIVGVKMGSRLEEKLTEDELRLVLIESLGKGSMADTKIDLIDNVFSFSKRTARHVMIARDDIVSLDLTEPIDENLIKAKNNNHTRYPLCQGSLDQIVGLINFKDVLWQSEESRENMDLRNIRREILFVPENKPLTKLLKDFQRNKIHMAIVIDEYGVTSGLVTLEDVLEELVGEIQDEYDQEVSRIQLMRDGSYLIDGGTLIEEVEEKLGIVIEKGDNTTIAGAVLSKMGRLPKVGDGAQFEDFNFIVKTLKGRRIYSVVATKKIKK